MKVLMIAPVPFFNDRGCSVRIYEEAMALQRRGHQVKIVAYHIGSTPEGIDVERTPSIPWYQKIQAGPSWHRLYIDVLLLLKAFAVNRRFRADIVHGHIHEGTLVGWGVARLFGVPLVFDFQGSMVEEISHYNFMKKGGVLERLFRAVEAWVDRMPDRILVATSSSFSILTDRFGIPRERIGTLLDGIGVPVSTKGAVGGALRRELGIPDDARIVAYAGSLSNIENIDGMLEAAQRILKREPRAFFLIAGHPNVNEYRTKAKGLGIGDHTLFVGRIPYLEVPRYLDLAELTVSAKHQMEANGKLYNYMASGKPVIAFDHPINREILDDLGYYPAEMTAGAFAHMVLTVLALPEGERRARGQALKARVEKYFSWDARAAELELEYAKLIASRSRTP